MENNVKVKDDTQSLQSCVSVSVREFRIGNLVSYNGNHNEIGIVSEILKNDLTEVSPYKIGINHRIDIRYNIDKLKPVPLTDDWLISFGFKTRTTVNTSIQYFIGENPITRDWLFDILWLEGDEYPFYRNGFLKIKYVHQLQNIYHALTGSELQVGNLTEH